MIDRVSQTTPKKIWNIVPTSILIGHRTSMFLFETHNAIGYLKHPLLASSQHMTRLIDIFSFTSILIILMLFFSSTYCTNVSQSNLYNGADNPRWAALNSFNNDAAITSTAATVSKWRWTPDTLHMKLLFSPFSRAWYTHHPLCVFPIHPVFWGSSSHRATWGLPTRTPNLNLTRFCNPHPICLIKGLSSPTSCNVVQLNDDKVVRRWSVKNCMDWTSRFKPRDFKLRSKKDQKDIIN